MRTVMQQFIDGFMHIRQGSVFLGFFKTAVRLGLPALGQLLERTHIDVAVVQKRFELGHVARQKAPVLADGIATQRHLALGHIDLQKGQHLCFGILLGER